ncbi:piriformospora indica-insensitive protein 2 [Magnolia sinica]|uniref:piriformospora indica-insensitive protein 2 n=1 Tax=Magnolia sinica TaxID=86752 RepID=UPI002659CC9F|nr:piriformospora indica-insensitive protein 2 [Magnolia sinica]
MKHFISIQSLVLLFLLHSLVAIETDTWTAPMLKTEKKVLYSVIRSLVGDPWNGSDLYPDPCGWTPIPGVSCDLFKGLWYVTVVSIGPVQENSLECDLAAEFSSRLFEFKRLKRLSFFDCFHRPIAIPRHNWENLAASLETLEFRSNPGLIGGIPTALMSLSKLQSLVLIENGLSGELPAGIGNLSELKRLVLAGNRFSGRIPPSLGALDQLLILDLSRNSLTGSIPTTVGGLKSLLKLDLSSNSIDGWLPFELGNLKNLTLLDLRYNRFSNGLPRSLLQMVSLEEILLSNNPIGGSLMESGWGSLKNLMVLDLSNMGLTGKIPESMAEMRRLRFLALDNNHLSGEIPPEMGEMPCINAVYLNGNHLTGEIGWSEGYIGKMGRRFAVWGNPDLCVSRGLVEKGVGPTGVKDCRNEGPGSSDPSGLKAEMGGGDLKENVGMGVSGCGGAYGRWRLCLVLLCLVLLHVAS